MRTMTDGTFRTGGPAAPGRRRATRTPGKQKAWWLSPRLILSVLIAAFAVTFIVQNREPTRIAFLTAVVLMPLWGALTAMGAAGLLIGYLLVRRR